VEIDAPDIEVTQPNLPFPAFPAGVPAGTPLPPVTFAISTAKLGAANNPDAGSLKKIQRLQITRVVFKADPGIDEAHPGIDDFSFLRQLTVKASSMWAGAQLSSDPHAITIVDYQAPEDGKIGAVLQLPVSPPADLLPLWGHTWLYLAITVSGDLPRFPWSMDVVFSLSLKLVE
jgi:hypothetical protein